MDQVPVTGIDVGKRFSEMAVLSPSNEVYARIRINHDSYSNFEKAFELLRKAEKEFAVKPVVVMESTGHYHKILFQSLTNVGYEVCVINPIQLILSKILGLEK
jgi:transposase